MQTKLNQDGHTALMLASDRGHASVVTLLLDAKADVDLADNVRYSFCKSCQECISEYVREHSDMSTLILCDVLLPIVMSSCVPFCSVICNYFVLKYLTLHCPLRTESGWSHSTYTGFYWWSHISGDVAARREGRC